METAGVGAGMSKPENTGPDVPRGEAGKWLPGASPNPGGRPRKLVEIERMLDAEYRDVASMRENFQVLRKLALQGCTNEVFDKEGRVCGEKTTYHPAYMAMLLDRLIGPVTAPAIDLSDVPEDELKVLREKLRQAG